MFHLLTAGLVNKEIAAELGRAEKTIKVHRTHILEKMQVRSGTALLGLLYRMKSHGIGLPKSFEAPRTMA